MLQTTDLVVVRLIPQITVVPKLQGFSNKLFIWFALYKYTMRLYIIVHLTNLMVCTWQHQKSQRKQ